MRRSVLEILGIVAVCIAVVVGFLFYLTSMPGNRLRVASEQITPELTSQAGRLSAHVYHLSRQIGIRHQSVPENLNATSIYIESAFVEAGYRVRLEEFRSRGVQVRNVEAELAGDGGELIIIGAHYDTLPWSKGANDNASGVAALLEIAQRFSGRRFSHTLRFVAFANEEAPFFRTEDMGSWVYARRSSERGERVRAMYALEMLGYYNDSPGSQRYPRIMAPFYPDTANFVALVSNLDSRALLLRSIAAFRAGGTFPAEGLSAPQALVPDVRRSDHASFWEFGYPAIMITDSGGFRYPFYHTSLDQAEDLNYTSMARVVDGLVIMIEAEANLKQ